MLASSLPILGFGFHEAFQWRAVSTEVAKERILTQSEALQNEIQRIFDYRLSAFEMLAEQIRLQSRTEPLLGPRLNPLMRFYSEKFGLISVGLTDMQGRVLEYYNPSPGARAKFIGKCVLRNGFIDLLLQYRMPVVTPLKRGLTRNLAFIAVPIWSYDKKNIIASIGGSVTPAEIQRIADNVMANSPLLQYHIVDQAGVLVAGSGEANDVGALKPAELKLYSPVTGLGPEIRQGANEKGEAMFAAAQKVNLRTAQWTVIVSESDNELLRNERAAWHQMVLIIICALAISFILASLISYLISKPIIRLINGMEMIQQGHYEQWAQMSEQEVFGFKEIHGAWRALVAMAKRLHEYTVNLEMLVVHRTRELDIQRERAAESARLASLGEMAGGIAHEINNPLSIISAVAEQQQAMFKQGEMDHSRTEAAFETISETTQRIVKIIQGLRSFSRDGGSDPIETVGLRSLLESTLSLCQQKFIHHHIELIVSCGSADLTLKCRSVQLSQVILNLLNNAFDAVEYAQKKWVKVEVKVMDQIVEIRVTDSGPGVPEQYREKIFQPFFTLKEVGKGTGLGLSISRSIVESQGGRLELDQSSKNTSFVIRFPGLGS
jgi:signal transduction histidine kinase